MPAPGMPVGVSLSRPSGSELAEGARPRQFAVGEGLDVQALNRLTKERWDVEYQGTDRTSQGNVINYCESFQTMILNLFLSHKGFFPFTTDK